MGIDEAGRGPVLGPMTYAAAYWEDGIEIPKGYNDSKQLTPDMRDKLFAATVADPNIGFVIRVLHAKEISQNMLRKNDPYNLNAMSHDAAMQMVQCVIDAGVTISKCYIDTVGREETYKARLDRVFSGSGIEFVVEKKADAKYVQCSAASVCTSVNCAKQTFVLLAKSNSFASHLAICYSLWLPLSLFLNSSIITLVAKVTRDRIVENWKFTELHFQADLDYGSGYPSDPKCKAWMARNMEDKLFCYPDLVRFSWGPVKDACKDKGIKVEWEADEEDEQQGAMLAFVSGAQLTKRPRLAYFETHKLKRVAKLASR